MKRIAKLTSVVAILFIFAVEPAFAVTQTNSNRKPTVKGEMKESGKETKQAGKSLGTEVKHGRVVRGGKKFGKHMYKAGKHFGKGSAVSAKKTGKAVKKAVKP